MWAERLGSYSIASTVAGMSIRLRLKSMMRYSCLWPPPMRRDVSRPYALRPPVLCLGSVRPRWGRSFERPTCLLSEVNRCAGREGPKCLMGMAWVSGGSALDELDLVAGLQGHDRLLVVGGRARLALAAALVLAAVVLGVDPPHRDLEGRLDGLGDGVLVRALKTSKVYWPSSADCLLAFSVRSMPLRMWSAFISSSLR